MAALSKPYERTRGFNPDTLRAPLCRQRGMDGPRFVVPLLHQREALASPNQHLYSHYSRQMPIQYLLLLSNSTYGLWPCSMWVPRMVQVALLQA